MKGKKTGNIISCISLIIIIMTSACSGDNHRISASGTIEATSVMLSSKGGGVITDVYADEGAIVKKGDILAEIDHIILDLQLRQAKVGVDLAKLDLTLLTKGARIEDIKQAEEALISAKTNLEQATEDYNRMNNLFAKGSVTQKQKDDAAARLTLAQAQYNTTDQALKKLKNLARPEDLDKAKLRIEQMQLQVKILEEQIRDATIVAPIAGVISHKLIETGELVTPGRALFSLLETEKLSIMIYITEPEMGKVRLNQKAGIFIDSFPEREFRGSVTYISPEAEFTPKNIQTKEDRVKLVYGVKISIQSPEGILKPGMPADAILYLN
ncbi:MAG: efflux RND transporter periplasmic adaptor subunit [Spirochaetales bacterium]|nr:efflux RND transporter periplasmic adaptor subunit [Spirochaetales bacterium]